MGIAAGMLIVALVESTACPNRRNPQHVMGSPSLSSTPTHLQSLTVLDGLDEHGGFP